MKIGGNIIIIAALAFFAWGCFRAPELPQTPKIKFERLQFKDEENAPDLLTVEIQFEDGDGDLGLAGSEIDPPYQRYDVVLDGQGSPIRFGSADDLPPYDCIHWLTDSVVNASFGLKADDTLLIELNENHNNIFVDFYIKEGGEFTLFDWNEEYCIPFDGRFPLLSQIDNPRPLSGSLKYAMTSAGFNLVLKKDTFKLAVQIQDRALNKSNIVETPEITLDDILVE